MDRQWLTRFPESLRASWRLLLGIAFLPVATSWLADYAREWVHDGGSQWQTADVILLVLAVIVLFVAAAFLLSAAGSVLVRVSRLERADAVRPHRVWVGALSPLQGWRWEDGAFVATRGEPVRVELPAGDPMAAAERMQARMQRCPWEQVVRGLRPHTARLERVFLLTSPGGSANDFDACAAMIRHVLGRPVEVMQKQCAFDSLDDLLSNLRAVVREAGGARDTILDITGGFKLVSIAAAMVSLEDPELELQYVLTEGDKQVLAFNVVTVQPTTT